MQTMIFCEYTFDSAHDLSGFVPEGHKCARLHGHRYEVRLEVSGDPEAAGANGMVIDYAILSGIYREVIHKALDHRNLNEIIGVPSTSERLSAWIFQRVAAALPPSCTLSAVEVRETAKAGARVEGSKA